MCIAAPGKVININGKKATVQYGKETREVVVGDEKITVGDFVLVQMGIVIQKLKKSEALESMKAWGLA